MNWPLVALKDCVRVVGGATPRSEVAAFWEGDIPWTTPKDLSDLDGKFLNGTPRKITAAGLKSCASEILPPNSVLFSSRAPIGHVAINTVPMATNQGFKSMVPGPRVDASFLYWWLKCHRAQLELLGNGATFKEVSKAIVERIEIPLPPLDEQKRIAAILDQADELRRKRQQALTRLNHLGQAIFMEMFGDPTTNPRGWRTERAEKLAARITVGLVVRPASYYQRSGVPAIRGTNIKEHGIDLADVVYFSERDNAGTLAKSRIWSNDIVIVRSGRPGLAAIVPTSLDGANAIDVLIFTPKIDVIAPEFVRDLINSKGGKRLVLAESRGQVQQHFNVGSLSEATFFVPPYDLQVEYQTRIQSLREKQETYSSALGAVDKVDSQIG
jgi:type I restriction enzyme, S subunit